MEKEIKGTEKGTVKFFSQARGFGFIYKDNDQVELFFHINDCMEGGIFKEGQRVSFNVGSNRKGMCAVDITAKELLEEN